MSEDARFEWDQQKSALNRSKHGISFDEAASAFDDELALLMPDLSHSIGESRLTLIGASDRGRLLVVAHCERAEGSVIRIISARPANRMERHDYQLRNLP
jgi:uncharacterized DUF497 family protein